MTGVQTCALPICWLSRFVKYAFTNFEASKKYMSHGQVVGMPVRDGLMPQPRSKHDRVRVLVFGGSQGARPINNIVFEAVKKGGDWLSRVEMVHQIGTREFQKFKDAYKALTFHSDAKVECVEFLYDMPQRYAWADIVVCRAGASTVAELAACQKSAVLVPFPEAADNHQQHNAEALLKKTQLL